MNSGEPAMTFFTVPKPFAGADGVRQTNAIRSWLHTCPDSEVILFGDASPPETLAGLRGVRRVPDTAVNDYGTPCLDAVFARACAMASAVRVCFVNTDILLATRIDAAIERIDLRRALVFGERRDVEVAEPIEFGTGSAWVRSVEAASTPHKRSGSDYFILDRRTPLLLPRFAVGRPYWDNWLIGKALQEGFRAVDASGSIAIYHQNHGYGHVRDRTSDDAWNGPEGARNLDLSGPFRRCRLDDASHVLVAGHLARACQPNYMTRAVGNIDVFDPPWLRAVKKTLLGALGRLPAGVRNHAAVLQMRHRVCHASGLRRLAGALRGAGRPAAGQASVA